VKAIPHLIGNKIGKSSPIFPDIPLKTHPIRAIYRLVLC
jgi:hypothetical protein